VIERRARLRGLLESHRRWRVLFAVIGAASLALVPLARVFAASDASLVRRLLLGLAGFFALNALASWWKARALAERVRAIDAGTK
jgi:hypothetical protein